MQVALYAVLIVGACVVYALAAVVIARRLIQPHVREGHNDVLVPLFLTAGTLYAVLLGFLVIAVWENYDAAKANAAEEASTLTTLYRQTSGMQPNEQAEFRALIRSYTENVIHDEWAIQAKTGGASPKARADVVKIYSIFKSLPPNVADSAISADFLRTFDSVADDRNRRTLQANESLAPILWICMLAGGAVVIAMACLLFMERRGPQLVAATLMAALIGSLLFMLAILDRPYAGPLALSADDFEHSISVYASVDQAP